MRNKILSTEVKIQNGREKIWQKEVEINLIEFYKSSHGGNKLSQANLSQKVLSEKV